MANTFGVLAEFSTPGTLYEAAKKTVAEGYVKFDTYSPFPIHGMDGAMSMKESKLGWIVFVGGFFGLTGALLMQWWMGNDYQYILSGKEFFSLPASIPVTFELMVLLSAFAAVFGMFAINRLPQHYHPLFKSNRFRGVTTDKFFLAIESSDPKYNQISVKEFLQSIGATHVEVINS